MNPLQAGKDEIVQQIRIQRPAVQIFDALTSPEKVLKWWGFEGKFKATHMESDLRPAGRWRMRLVRPNGQEITLAGTYRTIERPHLLIYTWIREQEDGMETLVRWDLKEENGITTVRVTHSGLTSKALLERNSGWPLILGLLQAYVEQLK